MVVWLELQYLMVTLVGELNAVVGYQLVDLTVLVAFGLGVADEYYHLGLLLIMEKGFF